MTTFSLRVSMSRGEGALLRVLGTSLRRGFEPVAVDARAAAEDGTLLDVHMTVLSERSPEQLVRQLAKLIDVRHVEVES